VPPCSTCNLVVEWGRSCYASSWAFFRGSPNTLTRGRYYFARPATPHAPGPHFLGSRDWHDKNNGLDVPLGESMTAERKWDAGLPPPLLPNNQTIGAGECLSDGASLAAAIDPATQVNNGFNALCFEPCTVRDSEIQAGTDFAGCQTQKFYAKVIDRMYNDDGAAVATLFYQLLGPSAQVTFRTPAGLMPAVTTVVTPTVGIIVLDGTRDFQQLALQALTSIVTPTNFGVVGTVPLWWNASSYINTLAQADGITATMPVMIVGHSYGGAVALTLAARYRPCMASLDVPTWLLTPFPLR